LLDFEIFNHSKAQNIYLHCTVFMLDGPIFKCVCLRGSFPSFTRLLGFSKWSIVGGLRWEFDQRGVVVSLVGYHAVPPPSCDMIETWVPSIEWCTSLSQKSTKFGIPNHGNFSAIGSLSLGWWRCSWSPQEGPAVRTTVSWPTGHGTNNYEIFGLRWIVHFLKKSLFIVSCFKHLAAKISIRHKWNHFLH